MVTDPYQTQGSFYKDKLMLLENARDNILGQIDQLFQYYTLRNLRNPIDHYKSRIKDSDKMKEKLKRHGLPVTLEAALSEVYDAVGVRIVCTFIDDVYTIRNWFKGQSKIEVIEEKDYIKSPKSNGYRSYHMIAKIPVDEDRVYAEIQIRTLAMDCWASLEHQLKYKQTIRYQKMMVDELKRCADEIASTDMNLQAIRELIAPTSNEYHG